MDGSTPRFDEGTANRSESTGRHGSNRGPSRRRFLKKAVGAGALATGFGTGFIGNAAGSSGVPPEGTVPPALHVDGNRIEDPAGNQVTLRGVCIADPKRVDLTAPARGKNTEQVIDLATDADRGWYSQVIRLPVQPVDIGEHPPGVGPPPVAFSRAQLDDYLETHLDSAVEKCRREGVYCIIDYHRHRNTPWTDEALSREVQLFWDAVANRYAGQSHVLFEVYNEPQGNPQYGVSGRALIDYWRTWKAVAQPWVDTIRSHAPENLVLVGSPRYSQLPHGALIEEFNGGNLLYTLHYYPAHEPDTPEEYDEAVTLPYYGSGDAPYPTDKPAWTEVPLFCSEWGYDPDGPLYAGGGVADSNPNTTVDPDYGADFSQWLSDRPIGWTAWAFDPAWFPRMFDRSFVDEDDASIGNPYTGTVRERCSDRPCEWDVLGEPHMGALVKDMLATERGEPPAMEGGEVSIDRTDRSTWQHVPLAGTYSDPVVLMNPLSYNGGDPAHIRLRNVGDSGFEFLVEEWKYNDGKHTAETASYLVIEAGAYAIGDSTRIEAGTVSTNATFSDLDFEQDFTETPIALTQTQTYNGDDPVIVRQRNLTPSGTELAVQEEEAHGTHTTERIGCVAIDPGVFSIDGTRFEANRTANTVTDDWKRLGFRRSHDAPRFLASTQTFNGNNPVGLRYRSLSESGVEVKLEEERSADAETTHTSETVGYLVADQPSVTCETGSVRTGRTDRSTWQRVPFAESYSDPVVLMNPLSYNGGDPAHVRLRNVGDSGFEFLVEEWKYDDGRHVDETIGYAVFEAGTHTTSDGTRIEAGTTRTDESFTNASFSQRFPEPPVVLAQAQTYNGGDPIAVRQRSASSVGTDLRVQEEEAKGAHTPETVGYLAVEPGTTNLDGVPVEVARTSNIVTDEWCELAFDRTYADPQFLAGLQTFNGSDPAGLRYRDLSESGIEVKIEEERSADAETTHTSETIGYLVFGRQ